MFEPKNAHREMPQAKLLQLLQLHNCPNNHCNPRRLQPLHILGIIYIYTYYIYIGLCTEWRFKKYRHGIYHRSWMFFCSFAAAWWRLLLVVLFVCNIIIYYCIAIIAFMIYKRTTYIYMHNIMIIYIIFIIIIIYICMCVYTWTEVYMDVTTRKAPGASRTTCNRHSGVNLDLER